MFDFISKKEGLRLCKLAVNSAMRQSHRDPMDGLEVIPTFGTDFIGREFLYFVSLLDINSHIIIELRGDFKPSVCPFFQNRN